MLSVLCCNVYPGREHLAFMLRNLAAQTYSYRDSEIIVLDAFQEVNSDWLKGIAADLGLIVQHVPACLHSHVGSWLHWEVLNNAALFASNEWLLYFGVYRYMHREAVATVAERASRDISVVLAQGAATADAIGQSPVHIEQQYEMHCRTDPFPFLAQTGFFSIRRDVLLNELNGHNEALVIHHWVDVDLGERSKQVNLKVEVMRHALVRIAREGHYEKMAMPQPVCDGEKHQATCAAWLMNALGAVRRIDGPVDRFTHDGFEWIRCRQCHCILVENPDAYRVHIARQRTIKAPINVAGVGRNLATLAADLNGLSLADKIALVQSSHTDTRYLQ